MDEVTDLAHDPKIHIQTESYDDFVRTFCTNPRGFVVREDYGRFVCTNGHSFRNISSENTNFALLVRLDLTKPLENTTKYARSMAILASTIGGGKPILQRIGDLKSGRRSTQGRIDKSTVKPTLKDYTPGDISMALPHRILVDLLEALDVLDEIIPGVSADSNLIYAPEVKFYAMHLEHDIELKSSIENLYIAGDGTGVSGDIINAAATGVIAGRGIRQNLET